MQQRVVGFDAENFPNVDLSEVFKSRKKMEAFIMETSV